MALSNHSEHDEANRGRENTSHTQQRTGRAAVVLFEITMDACLGSLARLCRQSPQKYRIPQQRTRGAYGVCLRTSIYMRV